MPWLPSSHRGPVTVMGVGTGIAFVGALPVAITFGLGVKNSATIIGMGLVGFGLLVLLPGVCWCFVVQHRTYRSWIRKRRVSRRATRDDEDLATLPPDDLTNVELDSVLITDKVSCNSYGGTTLNLLESAPLKSQCSHQSQELMAVDEHDLDDAA